MGQKVIYGLCVRSREVAFVRVVISLVYTRGDYQESVGTVGEHMAHASQFCTRFRDWHRQ